MHGPRLPTHPSSGYAGRRLHSQGDHPVPGLASFVQAGLGMAEVEILTAQSICSSSMMALKGAWLALRCDEHDAALVVATEMPSRLLKRQRLSLIHI